MLMKSKIKIRMEGEWSMGWKGEDGRYHYAFTVYTKSINLFSLYELRNLF